MSMIKFLEIRIQNPCLLKHGILKASEEISKNPSLWTQVLSNPFLKSQKDFSTLIPLGGVCGRNPENFVWRTLRDPKYFPPGAPPWGSYSTLRCALDTSRYLQKISSLALQIKK